MACRTFLSSNGIGIITKDPVLKTVGATNVVEFSVVVNEYYGKDENDVPKVKSSFFNFEAWDSSATYLQKYANKGDMICFEAIPRQEKWEKDGVKKERIVFRLSQFSIVKKSPNNLDSGKNEE